MVESTAAVGTQYGHREPFRFMALKLGLVGPMRSTRPGTLLTERLNNLSEQLGTYPHATLNARDRKKQSTRLLRCECPACGYIARITQKWLAIGLPVCPCGTSLV